MRFSSLVLAPCLYTACTFAGEELPIIEADGGVVEVRFPDAAVVDPYDGPPGVLDPTFGVDGIANDFRGSVAGMAIAPDDSIYVTGTHYAEAGRGLAVAHYLELGEADLTFGTAGIIDTTLNPFLTDDADAVQLLMRNDRSIVAIGRVKIPEPEAFNGMAIVVLDRYGRFEPGFGDEGRALRIVSSDPPAEAVPIDGVLTRAGEIAVAGFIPGNPPNPFLARFDNTGDLTGAVMYGEGLRISAIDSQADGKLIAGGYQYSGRIRQDVMVMRTQPSGVIDTSFAENGFFILDLEQTDVVSDVAVQADGKIVVVGNTVDDRGFPRSFLLRLLPDGAPDLDFGDRAIKALDDLGLIMVSQVAIAPTGEIVIGGEDRSSGSTRVFLLRYTADGQLDTQFGHQGMLHFNALETPSYVSRIAFDSRGRILMAGAAGDVVRFFITRVLP